ncbi:MAG: lipoprotein [Gammaproteobacteria bacterium]|nr:lipoprotein [Gammaproteobacteria bacterium]
MKNIIALLLITLVLTGCSAGAHLDFYGKSAPAASSFLA